MMSRLVTPPQYQKRLLKSLLVVFASSCSLSLLGAENDAPSYALDVAQNDTEDASSAVEQALEVYVPVNQPPILQSVGMLEAKEGEVLSLRLQATDPENQPLTFSLDKGPAGLGLSSDGLLQWVLDYDSAGKHDVQVTVSDGELTDSNKWVLVVDNNNRPPQFSSDPVTTVNENSLYEYRVEADDPDGDKLRFSLNHAPKKMTFDGRTIRWTPTFEQSGNYSFSVVAKDASSETVQNIDLMVVHVNRPPIWTSSRLGNAKEGEIFSQMLKASDPDADQLMFEVAKGPQGLTITEEGLLSWSPDFDTAGEHVIEVLLSDGEETVAKRFTLQVTNTNREPQFTSVAALHASEASEYNYWIETLDPDADTVNLTLRKSPKGMILEGQQLHWVPSYTQAGVYPVILEVSDGTLKMEQRFEVTVENTNRLPVWQTETLTGAQEAGEYNVILEASDADGDALSYQLQSGPEGLTVSDTGVMHWLPSYESAGTHQLALVVNDGQDQTTKTLAVTVSNTNREPEFTAQPPLQAAETSPYQYDLMIHDADGDVLIAKLQQGPVGMTLQNNKLQWTPSFEQSGSHSVEVEILDAESSIKQVFQITVSNTNREPVFTPPTSAVLSLQENSAWSLPLDLVDADNDTLSLKISNAPAGVTLKGQTLHWTPTYIQAGVHKVRVAASDAESVVYLSLDLHVENTNRAPQISSPALLNAKEDEAYEYEVKAFDLDINEDKKALEVLSYKVLSGPEGMAFAGERLVWKPNFDHAGEHVVKIQVSDGSLMVEQAFTLTVANTNRAPAFDSVADVYYILEDETYEYDIDVMDLDADNVTLSLEKGPEGLQLTGRSLRWKTGFKDAGEYSVVLKASDGDLETLQPLSLLVENNNRLPVFVSEPKKRAFESVDYRYQIKVSDDDKEQLGLILLEGPDGMRLKDQGLISWTPAFDQFGEHDVKISVSDGIDTQYQTFTVNVIDTNRGPTFPKIAKQSIIAGNKFRYDLAATDVDGDSLSYVLVHAPSKMEVNKKGSLYWKVKERDVGTHTVIVSVSDGDLKVRRYFDITVQPEK